MSVYKTFGLWGTIVVLWLASALQGQPASADVLTWTGTAGATWDVTTNNWSTWSGVSGGPYDSTNGTGTVADFVNGGDTPVINNGNVYANGVQFDNTATITGANVLNLVGASPTITVNASGGTISSTVAGSAGLIKAGTGALLLTSANTYSGGTVLSAGTLISNNTSALGGSSNPLTLNGGTLDFASGGDSPGYNMTFNANATILCDPGLTPGAPVTHQMGTLTVGASDTFTAEPGPNSTSGLGRFYFQHNITTGNGAILDVEGNGLGTNLLLLLGPLVSSGNIDFRSMDGTGVTRLANNASGRTSGTATIDMNGTTSAAGILQVFATNAFGSGTSLQLKSGHMNVSAGGSITAGYNTTVVGNFVIDLNPAGGGTNTANFGTLSIGGNTLTMGAYNASGATTFSYGATTLSGNATFNFADDGALTGTPTLTLGAVSDSGSGYGITELGIGKLVLSASDNYSGTTLVGGGNLTVGNVNALQNSTLDTGPAGTQTFTFSVGGNNTYNLGGLKGSNNLTLSSNTLNVGANNGNTTYSGAILSGGAVVKSGTGALTLGAANTYSGGTYITAGTVRLGVNNALPQGIPMSFGAASSSGTLDLAGFNQTVAGLAVNASVPGGSVASQVIGSSGTGGSVATLTFNGASSTFGGTIQDVLGANNGQMTALTVSAGTLTLGGANTFSGPTLVNSGALYVNGSLLAGGSATVAAGATLGGTGTAGTVSVLNNGIIQGGQGGAGTFSPVALGFGGNATLNVNVSSATGYTPLDVTGSNGLSTSPGSVLININNAAVPSSGTYHLAEYSGQIQGSSTSAFALGSYPHTPRTVVSPLIFSDPGFIDVQFSTDTLTWTGSLSSEWSTGPVQNWRLALAGSATSFLAGDAVTFDNSSSTQTVDINSGNVAPSTVTFNNDAAHPYLLQSSSSTAYGIVDNGSPPTTLTKAGAGVLTITTSANTYSGGTLLQAGQIVVGVTNALPVAGALTLGTSTSSGTLDMAGNSQQLSGLAVAAGASPGGQVITTSTGSPTLTFSGGGYSVFPGTIQDTATTTGGTLGLTVNGGTLDVSGGATTYYGPTTVNGGALVVAGLPNTSSATVASGGALNVSGANQGFPALNNNGNVAFTGTSGTITLASLTGNGTTAFSAAAILPISSSSGTVNLNAPGASLIVSSGTQSSALLISGQGGLVKTGTDTVTLGVANTYTGGTTLNAGTLVATNLTSLGAVGTPLTLNGGTLDFATGIGNNSDQPNYNTTISANATMLSDASTPGGTQSHQFGTLNIGDVTLTVAAGPNETGLSRINFVGNVTISSGVIFDVEGNGVAQGFLWLGQLQNSGDMTFRSMDGTGIIRTTANAAPTRTSGTVTIDMGTNGGIYQVIYAGDPFGAGSTLVFKSGRMNLSAYQTVITPGYPTTVLGDFGVYLYPGSLGTTNATYGPLTIGNNTLTTGSYQANGNVYLTYGATTLTGNATFNVNDDPTGGGTPTLTLGAISDSGSGYGITENGTGTLVLSGSGAFSGGVAIIGGGLVQLGNATALGSGAVAVDNGTLDLAGYSVTVSSFSGAANGTVTTSVSGLATFTVNQATQSTFSGEINDGNGGGQAALNLQGGTLTLGSAGYYTGGTTVTGGLLQLGNAAALGTGGLAANGGTLDLAGYSVTVSSFSGAAGVVANSLSGSLATLTVTQSSATTFSGAINDGLGQVALWLTGGTLTLSGTNGYTGGTTVENSTLIVQSSGAIEDGTNLSVGSELSLFGTIAPAQAGISAAADHGSMVPAVAPVPEPGTLALLAAGVALAIGLRRRMGRKAKGYELGGMCQAISTKD